MRIGIDACDWSGQRGLGRYLRCLAEALAARHELDVVLFCPYELGPGVPTGCQTRVDVRRLPWYSWRLPGLAKRENLDVMFFPTNHAWWSGPAPSVVTIHDLAFLKFPRQLFRSRREAWYEGFRLRWALKHAAAVCADSMATRQDIVSAGRCDASAVSVVHPGIARVFQQAPALSLGEVAARHSLRDRPYIMYAGGLDFRKNIPALLEAYAELVKGGTEHDLLLVGETGRNRRYYPDIDGLVADFHLSDRVKRLSGVNDEELVTLYRNADLFVFPSLFEGFGLPPLEAMACGAPVVCSNATSLPEVVGDAAELFDPNNVNELVGAMRRVLTNQAWADELRARGKKRAELFTWERTADWMIALFREVVAREERH